MLQTALTRNFPSPARLLDDSFFLPSLFYRGMAGDEAESSRVWAPPVDIRETEEAYLIEAELPGLKKEDLEITLENNTLTLSGERTFKKDETAGKLHRTERTYGAFSRSFSLPTRVDAEGVKANFHDGVLVLTLPKKEEDRSRKIEIS